MASGAFQISQAGRYSSLTVCSSPSLCSSVFGYSKVNVLDSALVTAQLRRQPVDVSYLDYKNYLHFETPLVIVWLGGHTICIKPTRYKQVSA